MALLSCRSILSRAAGGDITNIRFCHIRLKHSHGLRDCCCAVHYEHGCILKNIYYVFTFLWY